MMAALMTSGSGRDHDHGRPVKAFQSNVITLRSGRSIDLRNVDPIRLMSADECEEVAAALRQRWQNINARIAHEKMTPIEGSKARKASEATAASRMAVIGRMKFLQGVGDQHVELMSDAAKFVEAARRRLGREVFDEIMADARRGAGARFNFGG